MLLRVGRSHLAARSRQLRRPAEFLRNHAAGRRFGHEENLRCLTEKCRLCGIERGNAELGMSGVIDQNCVGLTGPIFWGDGVRGALFDASRVYRYSLWRRFCASTSPEEMAVFIGLNPSTADETDDDPTIRRCIGFAKRWGYGGLVMLNLFAYRATHSRQLKRAADPVGPRNDLAIRSVSATCGPVICCWGVHGTHRERDSIVLSQLRSARGRSISHLGLTKAGQPKHPLYLPACTRRIRWAVVRNQQAASHKSVSPYR